MRNFRFLAFTIFIACSFSLNTIAQETQTRVVDEVVAVVNDGVITLSRIKREKKSIVDTYVQEGKSRDEAQRMVDEKQGELIAGLINEELLVQRAKEGGMDRDIEEALNERFVDVMNQFNLKTVEALHAEMEKTGVDPKELRETWRTQIIRERVIQREVQSKVYWEPTGTQVKEYYEKNKSKFTKPETVSISELFLGFAGRDEATVREAAKQIHAQLRAGGDFEAIAKDRSDPGPITQGKGKAEKLPVADLVPTIGNPLKDVKPGDVTVPFEADKLGMIILRVDAREKASNESAFEENIVRVAMMNERLPTEQKKYMAKLREDSYIKINDTYRPSVAPILFADDRTEKSNN